MEERRPEGRSSSEEILVNALLEAEKEARRFLEEALGKRSSNAYLVLRLEKRGERKILVAEARAEWIAASREDLERVVDEALDRAFRVFEEKTGLKPLWRERR
ncbi:MAG: hypothetical protein QXS85_02415 [Acidilobaceae archaeon]